MGEKVMGEWSSCKSDFAAMAKGSGKAAENTQACREYHLGLALDDAKLHCPHASKHGGGVCSGKKDGSGYGSDYGSGSGKSYGSGSGYGKSSMSGSGSGKRHFCD